MSDPKRRPVKGEFVFQWQRRKDVYDRRQLGESNASIAQDLDISTARVSQLARSWEWALGIYQSDYKHSAKLTSLVNRLIDAGLMDAKDEP